MSQGQAQDAPAAPASIEILSPLGAWESNAGQLELGEGKIAQYCAISNAYRDNGRLEFYGVQGSLAAIKVDFPGKTFVAGQNLDATLKMPGSYTSNVKGVVVGTSTLILNVKGDAALISALHNGQLLYIGLAGQDYPFSLSGINKFGERLSTCRNQNWDNLLHDNVFQADMVGGTIDMEKAQARNIQGTESPLNSENATLEILKSPPVASDGIVVEEIVEDEVFANAAPPPAPAPPARPQSLVPIEEVSHQPVVTSTPQSLQKAPPQQEAPAQESLDSFFVPSAPSQADPPQLATALPATAPPVRPPSMQMKAVPPPVPLYEGPQANPQPPVTIEENNIAASASPVWRALKGSSLREVLALWSLDNNVELIWNAEEQYRVRETLNLNSSYENAVETLLMQYELGLLSPDVRRPVGQLYVDPQQNKKILVIRSQAG